MRRIIAILSLVFCSACAAQEIVVFQINAAWNSNNTRQDLISLRGCEYLYGNLEDQNPKIIESITCVPVVVVYKDGIAKRQFAADLSFQLKTSREEIQNYIDELRDN